MSGKKDKSRGAQLQVRLRGGSDFAQSYEEQLAVPVVRNRFLDTAFWTPAVVTDKQGSAAVTVTWPDNLTQWRAQAVGNTTTAQVGSGETRVTIKKDLLVRLQAPRFFVERDQVVLSANVQNYLAHAAHVKVRLELGSDAAEVVDSPTETWVDIPQEGEKRVDWTVQVKHPGDLRVRMIAQTTAAADATELTLPVLVHGVERMTTQSGVLREQSHTELTIALPEARKPNRSELVVQLNPSLGAIMLDALPYLLDYPYGCVEQTMSRFLPAVVVAKTMKDLGVDLDLLRKRAVNQKKGVQANRNPAEKENSAYTYPKGRPGLKMVPSPNQERWRSPVFESRQLKKMVTEGLDRLAKMQHADGGWGWWSDDTSDPYMSSYVLYGLQTAKSAGYGVPADMLARGQKYLREAFAKEEDIHRRVYEARVLVMDRATHAALQKAVTGPLFEKREQLSVCGKALLAMALHALGEREKATILLGNMETTLQKDEVNGTASWDDSNGSWWQWYNNRVEVASTALQAYLTVQPNSTIPLMLVKWLVNNRRASTWNSTKETAEAVYALAGYVRVNKELAPNYTLTVGLADRVQWTYKVTKENALLFDNEMVVPDELLETGNQTLSITKEGQGTCYYAAYTRYFSQEEPIAATSNEIAVQRRYFRLLPNTASGEAEPKPIDLARPNPFLTQRYDLLTLFAEETILEDTSVGPHYDRVALQPGEIVQSGDLLEVELQLESKNDYDYLVFEDMKPAGCEPVELRSGAKYGNGLYSNMELRDQKVAFFLSHLPQGTRTLTYRLRAEIPGTFHVLPTNGYAMYAPDIRALSDEGHLNVQDEEQR